MEEQTPLVRWSRLGAMALAWLFTAGVAIQIFLAGLALFDTAERWDDHSSFGMMIGILVLPLLVLVPLGRAGRQLIGMTVVLVVLYIAQVNLPNVDASYVAALHPLVAFALLGMSGQLGARLRDLAQSARQAESTHTEASFHHG
jgi:cell division protein FtsW (lipid II flippase)